MIRQGDILLVPCSVAGDELERARAAGDILARGEATGHAHRVQDPSRAQVLELERDGKGIWVLRVLQPTFVVHDTHAPVPVAPGLYEIRRQREMTLDELIRHSAD